MAESIESTTLHDPNRPEEGDSVVYGIVLAHDPERVLYVGATCQHPAVRVRGALLPGPGIARRDIRYVILWAGDRAGLAAAERECIESITPPWNTVGGGSGRGLKIDVAEAVRLYQEGRTVREVAKLLGCHHATVARAVPDYLRREPGRRQERRVSLPPADLARL